MMRDRFQTPKTKQNKTKRNDFGTEGEEERVSVDFFLIKAKLQRPWNIKANLAAEQRKPGNALPNNNAKVLQSHLQIVA